MLVFENAFLMVEKGPFGVSNNRCTSAAFGLEILMSLGPTHRHTIEIVINNFNVINS